MAKRQTLKVLESAIKNPTVFAAAGDAKNRLRAAFDIVAADAYGSIFGPDNISLLNMRQTLNACKKKDYKAAQWKIIEALRNALKEAEISIHASDYSDHTADIEKFIKGPMKQFYEALP